MTEATAPATEALVDEATMQELIKLNEQRAATYGLLSRLYRVEVDQPLLDELRSMRFPAKTGNENVDEGYRLLATYLSNTWDNSITDLAIVPTGGMRGLEGLLARQPELLCIPFVLHSGINIIATTAPARGSRFCTGRDAPDSARLLQQGAQVGRTVHREVVLLAARRYERSQRDAGCGRRRRSDAQQHRAAVPWPFSRLAMRSSAGFSQVAGATGLSSSERAFGGNSPWRRTSSARPSVSAASSKSSVGSNPS